VSYQAQYEQEVQEYQQLNSAYEQQRAETVKAHTEAQLQQLPTIFPEAMDPKKGPAIVKEIQTALLEADMTAEGLSMVTAKQMKLVHDALQWRKAQAKRTTLRPKTDAKTTARPMKAKARASSSNKPGKRSQAFRKNPSKGNAMAALMDID
jgi:ABC-type phosphate transport system auxiliary subunit